MLEKLRSDRYLIPICFFCIYFIWGSTYLATDWALDSFPPFFMTGMRLLTAGVLVGLMTFRNRGETSKKQLFNSFWLGILFLGIGSGGSMWAILYIDSGMTSLLISSEPLLLVFFIWLILGERPTIQKLLGVGVGMLGMYVLISQDAINTTPDTYKGVIAVFIAITAWSIGSVYVKIVDLPSSKLFNTAIQMLSGGTFLVLVSFFSQEDLSQISTKITWVSTLCLLYLIFFGSIIAFSAFNYLLIKEDPSKVATVAYVNPVIALFLGWSINNEVISFQALIAAALLLTGVIFIIRAESKLSPQETSSEIAALSKEEASLVASNAPQEDSTHY